MSSFLRRGEVKRDDSRLQRLTTSEVSIAMSEDKTKQQPEPDDDAADEEESPEERDERIKREQEQESVSAGARGSGMAGTTATDAPIQGESSTGADAQQAGEGTITEGGGAAGGTSGN